jgi:hypothetical protein
MIQRGKRLFFIVIITVLCLGQYFGVTPAWAQVEFDQNYVLSDDDLLDYNSLNLVQIQGFLLAKNSTLANYKDPITSLRADQIIYSTAQEFQISPKFILALLQKEQSLIEDPSPSNSSYDWATGYAVCDGCDVNDPVIQKFKGFYNQVYSAAKRIRLYYLPQLESSGKTISGFGPGIAKSVDGVTLVPANRATAIVYTYTPHLKGNRLLWVVWNRYFTRSYPDGTLLNVDGEKEVWLIENGQRRKFANRNVYLSLYDSFERVLTVNRTELLKYPEGRPVKFANYSFLRTPRGTVYLVVNDTVRGFASREALRLVGVNPEEIIKVAQEDLVDYGEGQPITAKSIYPLGTLLQDKKTGGVYWVQDGVKHPIWSREILKTNFGKRRLTKVTTKQLEQYPVSSPVLFKEGELVKSSTTTIIYLISNKQRRPFVSEQALTELGYDLKNVIATTDDALGIHELGEAIVSNF